MPRPRFSSVEPALKDAIFKAAAEEFATRGYDGASLNRIIELAGLSKGSFYYYFDDKLDLAAAVLVDASFKVAPSMARLQQATTPAEFWDAVTEYQREGLKPLLSSPRMLDLIARMGLAFAEHPELAARVMADIKPLWVESLAAWKNGQRIGAVRSDVSIELLMAVIQRVKEALAKVLLAGPVDARGLEAMAQLQLDFVRRLSRPEPAAPPEGGPT